MPLFHIEIGKYGVCERGGDELDGLEVTLPSTSSSRLNPCKYIESIASLLQPFAGRILEMYVGTVLKCQDPNK